MKISKEKELDLLKKYNTKQYQDAYVRFNSGIPKNEWTAPNEFMDIIGGSPIYTPIKKN